MNLFRGHSDATWQLLPCAQREGSLIEGLVSNNVNEGIQKLARYRWLNESDEKLKRRVELALRNYFQIRTIFAFLEVARDWRIDESMVSTVDSDEAQNKASPYKFLTSYMESNTISSYCGVCLHSQITAQHHGVPTSLLDFSSSFEIASDFASRDAYKNGRSHLAVWAIVDSPPLDLCHAFGLESPYLQHQKSYMLLNSCADITYYETGKWIPFETRLSNTMPLGSVFKVTLLQSEVESLRARLRVAGTRLYMMGTPMYESAKSLQRRIDCRRNNFCNDVKNKLQIHIDWDLVPIDEKHRPKTMAQPRDYCEKRCNDHCNTVFSTTFK